MISNDQKLTNLDSITINREPTSDNEVSNKKYVANELDKNTILSFNQTSENYLKVSAENDTYIFTKYDKIHKTDTTTIVFPNTRANHLQNWKEDVMIEK